jgi:hypothetical protein
MMDENNNKNLKKVMYQRPLKRFKEIIAKDNKTIKMNKSFEKLFNSKSSFPHFETGELEFNELFVSVPV